MSQEQPRSEAEQALPEWVRNAMDRARSGIDPMTNGPCSRAQAAAFVNSWLPHNDPGRMAVHEREQ